MSALALAVLRWTPPLLAAVVMVAALWVSAAAMSSVAAGLAVAAGFGLVPPPPAFVPVVAVDGTILAATAVTVAARRDGRGWHRPALGSGGAALVLSMALNVTHVLAARAALSDQALLALAVTFAALFPVAAAVTLHLALDGLAPSSAQHASDVRSRADLAVPAREGAGARARVSAVLDAHTTAGGDPNALTGPQVAAAAGCSLRRAQELLAELRAPAPVPAVPGNGHPGDQLEEASR